MRYLAVLCLFFSSKQSIGFTGALQTVCSFIFMATSLENDSLVIAWSIYLFNCVHIFLHLSIVKIVVSVCVKGLSVEGLSFHTVELCVWCIPAQQIE